MHADVDRPVDTYTYVSELASINWARARGFTGSKNSIDGSGHIYILYTRSQARDRMFVRVHELTYVAVETVRIMYTRTSVVPAPYVYVRLDVRL